MQTTRKTKIVATLGPASNSPETINQLIETGVNVFRLNFSHGDHEGHAELIKSVREQAAKNRHYVAVLQDLCGPKVRIGEFPNGSVELCDSAELILKHKGEEEASANLVYVEAFDPALVIKPGDKILLSDGQIVLSAISLEEDAVRCRIDSGGQLRSRSGISVPDSNLSLSPLTEKDLKDLEWTKENDPDYVALSFVSSADDVRLLREELLKRGCHTKIVAKIERADALADIDEIVKTADAVMVARGDLGLELPQAKVPQAQKTIIRAANASGTPVITATQMLQSMVHQMRPTRAEVSDIATAVRDGTDAVMLSEETAVGRHPKRVIEVLDQVLTEVEKEFVPDLLSRSPNADEDMTVPEAICFAACQAAKVIRAKAIIACTLSGFSATLVSKYRPDQPLFAVSPEESTLRRVALIWGVMPIRTQMIHEDSTEVEIWQAMEAVRDTGGLPADSRVVITSGLRVKTSGSTSLIEVRKIPQKFV
jgi:pyruvate kinase